MKSTGIVMLGVLCCCLLPLAVQASPRTWADSHGRTTRAKFVRVYRGNVVLLRGNRVLKVPFGNLSQQDQHYVRDQLEAKGQMHLLPLPQNSASEPVLLESLEPWSRPLVQVPPPAVTEPRPEYLNRPTNGSRGPGPMLSAPIPVSRRASGIADRPVPAIAQLPTIGRMTVEEANEVIVDRLFQETGSRDVPRRKSFSETDWSDAKRLVRVEQGNVPMLGAPDLTAPKLNVLGVADAGEVFEFVAEKSVLRFMNPLGRAPDQSGLWYKVRLLEGDQGWIFAKPQGHQGPPIARSILVQSEERTQPIATKPESQQAAPRVGESLLKPLSDPKVSTVQRVGRGIGMVIGGGVAVLFLIGVFVALLLTAGGGWRWWWWRERVRRIMDYRVFSRRRRGGESSSETA